MQTLKINWSVVSKMTRIWWNLTRALESLQNFHFHLLLLCKVFNVWPEKVRGVISHDTKGWCKIWRKTDLWFGKWHEKFGKFSPEHLKVSKLELWWDPFVQSRKCMSLKLTEDLCVMTMNKIYMRNFTNFMTRALENLKKLSISYLKQVALDSWDMVLWSSLSFSRISGSFLTVAGLLILFKVLQSYRITAFVILRLTPLKFQKVKNNNNKIGK